jgi:hypothetical protein
LGFLSLAGKSPLVKVKHTGKMANGQDTRKQNPCRPAMQNGFIEFVIRLISVPISGKIGA